MDTETISKSAFTALSLIATPALLTNASCSLANSTITRMHRIHDTLSEILDKFEARESDASEDPRMAAYVTRLEVQAGQLIHALNTVYLALGSFSGATLITLLGATLFPLMGKQWFNALVFLGVALGAFGIACLIVASVRLFQATKISLLNIHEAANLIRTRHLNK